MNGYTENPLDRLYPEVDPHRAIPLSMTERFAITVAFGVMAYGAVIGNLTIAGVGFALALIACIVPAVKTSRRIRSQARNRFPTEDWVEYRIANRLNLGVLLPVLLGLIGVVIAAGFWYIPPKWSTLGGIIIASIVAAMIWFMPGLNPMWSTHEDNTPSEDEYVEDTYAEQLSSDNAYTEDYQSQPGDYPYLNEETTAFPVTEKSFNRTED
ncbi:hypothetical protein [Corynebacterium auriscanis]|uniref:hypothetical protein n=1 Tax=Corynebacterium auriscanis TaxID=99807 RepID=UPI003CE819AE